MKMYLSFLLFILHALDSLALVVKSPPSTEALIEQRHSQGAVKLIPSLAKKQWVRKKQSEHMHMLAKGKPVEKDATREVSVEGCIACNGLQVVYGKYKTADGNRIDNSYFLFKHPKPEENASSLPVAIHFHSGGFFSGVPWQAENEEVNAYLRAGFAVVSVGFRSVTQKYFYKSEDGANQTEELIHVSKDGKLSLDKNLTMNDYQVRIGKQEFITKYLYDATQVMEHLIHNGDKFGLDVNRTVFIGESTGGAAMQYLTWVYHQWHEGRYTPRGIVYRNAQLNYPVNNMLDENWKLFAETMGPQVRLADVVSEEACPTIVGNQMCGSAIGSAADYELCNDEWHQKALQEFCGEALKSATLGQVAKRQVWPRNDKEVGQGMEKLWYASENMQQHRPSDPFYLYVENSMNGTGPMDVSHHSVFALNFAKYGEMGDHGGHQYTVYYTDFLHMQEADRGMKRFQVSRAPPGIALPPAAAASPMFAAPGPAPAFAHAPAPAPAPGPAPGPAARAPAFEVAGPTVFNYLSTHGWREDVADSRNIEVASLEERVLYACLAVGIGPFRAVKNETVAVKESGALANTLPSFVVAVITIIGMLRSNV